MRIQDFLRKVTSVVIFQGFIRPKNSFLLCKQMNGYLSIISQYGYCIIIPEVYETLTVFHYYLFLKSPWFLLHKCNYDFATRNLHNFTFYLNFVCLMTCLISVLLLFNDLIIHSDIDFIPFILIPLGISIIGNVNTV